MARWMVMMVLADDFFNAHTLRLLFWLAVLLAVCLVAAHVLRKIRAESLQKEPSDSELVAKLSESHARGEVSDVEFRTIKTTLTKRLHDGLKDDGKTG